MKFDRGIDYVHFPVFQPIPLHPSRTSSHVPILIVIAGATATGKSSLALGLAARLNSVILSADSRQIYRHFDIGTAKPSLQEQKQVPHYLMDAVDPRYTLTLAEYQQAAQSLIQQIHHQSGVIPLLVGGTGLYIDAVVKGLKIPPVSPQPALRQQLTEVGQPFCYALLQSVDAAAAAHIHPHDAVRTQRALEVFYVAGRPISTLQGEAPPSYPILLMGLDCEDPARLKQRIAQRTQAMVAAGFLEEVKALLSVYGADLPLMRTLGYAEMVSHLQGNISVAEAEALTVKHTCQFAKRQRTWFRNRVDIHWLDADAPDLLEQGWTVVKTFIQQQLTPQSSGF